MKKQLILLPVVAALTYLTLGSNSGGMPANLTGNLAGGGCGAANSCHGKANNGVYFAFLLVDSNGTSVANYIGGHNYIIKVVAGNATANNLPKYGFQFTAVSPSTNAPVGAFLPASLPAGEHVDTLGSSIVVQQRYSLSPSMGTGGPGSLYTASCGWVAPASGTGRVKVFAAACLVNNNSMADTLTDNWNMSSLYFDEQTAGVSSVEGILASVNAWPNPVYGQLSISLLQVMADYVYMQVTDLSGKMVAQEHLKTGAGTIPVNTNSWPAGMYQVTLKADGYIKTIPVIKE